MNGDTARGIGIGLALGAILGLAIGYFTSPQSGRENREWVRERAGDVREKAGQIKDKVGTVAGHIRRKGDSHEEGELEEVES
jgi:gas vesicle protein